VWRDHDREDANAHERCSDERSLHVCAVERAVDQFSRARRAALTRQQFQSSDVEPVYVLFEDFTHVKFYRRSFFDVVEDEEGREGFSHVDDWVPQRLVTATGPNPLPR
jgi:hypothetical protein